MTPAHAHLIMNHLPIVGLPGAALLLAAGILRRSRELQVAALIGMVLVSLAVIPVFLTGEPAEDQIEHFAGVSEKTIEHHEDAARWALALTELAGLVALIGLVRSRGQRSPGRWAAFALLAGAIAIAALVRAGNLGGHIRHPEIDAKAGAAPAGGEKGEHGED